MASALILTLVVVSTGYQLFSALCGFLFVRFQRRELAKPAAAPASLPPVTLLKPLCGAVPDTYENLANTCRLDYPALQIVFGVADPLDPAVAVVNRLRRDFPDVDIELVVSDERLGSNAKVSNLQNMLARAKHDVLAIVDADIRAPRDYLRTIIPYLERPRAGLVTCAYRAVPARTLASLVEALFVNTDFGPMVTVARIVEKRSYAFGATICIRRRIFDAIGGFPAIADYLADDYQIGNKAVALGYESELAPVVVETALDLDSLRDVWAHQLRWARTYRICRPLSYLATIVTHTTLWATIYLLASGFSAAGFTAFAAAVGIRSAVGAWIADRALGVDGIWRSAVLIPVKDLFISVIWAAAFLGSTVRWGGTEFEVHPDGRMLPLTEPTPGAQPAGKAAA